MKLTKNERQIIKQDILDLDYLIKLYSNEKKFAKASECLKEKENLKRKLNGGKS